jgi:hypothetical protein
MKSRDIVNASTSTPTIAALAAVLPADAVPAVKVLRIHEGIFAAYSPAQETRASVWQMLTAAFGPLRDVSVAGAA